MPCVLIVEDDEDVRDFMDVLLRASGYETMTAANGAIGIEMMHHRKPCVVLLDMMMPVMDGWAFRSRQMADPDLRGVPVVCRHGPVRAAGGCGAPEAAMPQQTRRLRSAARGGVLSLQREPLDTGVRRSIPAGGQFVMGPRHPSDRICGLPT